MEQNIYFDNGSTSWPKAPGVAASMTKLLESGAFNINRGNYEGAYELENQVLKTRMQLARFFHAPDSRCVVFTPGITYSLNCLLKGFLKPGDNVLVSSLEHNAVMRPLCQLASQDIHYTMIPAETDGTTHPESIEALIRPETKAVIMLHASNVCGTILPIREIGEICRRRHLFFAVDTAQSAGSVDIDMQKCNIDFLAFTGHKGLLGPQGIGGFQARRGVARRQLHKVELVPGALGVPGQQGVHPGQLLHDAGIRPAGIIFQTLPLHPAAQHRVRAAHCNVKDHGFQKPPFRAVCRTACILRAARVS